MTKVLATVALGAASLAFVAACGGDGDGGTSTQRGVVGGKPVVTKSGQRVRVEKLLEGSAADTARCRPAHRFSPRRRSRMAVPRQAFPYRSVLPAPVGSSALSYRTTVSLPSSAVKQLLTIAVSMPRPWGSARSHYGRSCAFV
jgi:hypothetical protein